MDENLILPSRSKTRFPYRFVSRYCPCGKSFSLQLDARSNEFISAATHLDSRTERQTIVTMCPACGTPIDAAWLGRCTTEPPRYAPEGTTFADASHPTDSDEWDEV